MYKIIGADGLEYGPATAEILGQWITEGRANAQTRVLPEGATEWKPLGELPEFASRFTAAARPAVTPLPGPTPAPLPTPLTTARINPLAITSLVLGILSMTFVCCYGVPFNLLGIICSLIALAQIRNNPERERGQALAIAGLVLSIISILLPMLASLLGFAARTPGMLRRIYRL